MILGDDSISSSAIKVMAKRKKNKRKHFKKALNLDYRRDSERYCLLCEEYRTFKYNKMVFHSECNVCGSRCATKYSPEDRDKKDL